MGSFAVRRPLAAAATLTLVLALGTSLAPPAWADPGDIDTGFGDAGRVTTDFAGHFDLANGALVQGNGRVVAVGQAATGTAFDSNDFGVARYTGGGDPDTGFSTDGRVRTDFGGGDVAQAVAQQGDGKLVVVGSSNVSDTRVAVARYSTNGTLDDTFSGDGKTRTAFPGFDGSSAADVAIQPDGRIVVVGSASFVHPTTSRGEPGFDSNVLVARFKPNGSLDPTFGGGDGWVSTDFKRAVDSGTSVALLSSGAILVAGQSQTPALEQRFIAVKYLATGARDGTFGGGDGKVVVNMVDGEAESAVGVAVRPDGKILLGGWARNAVNGSSEADIAVLLLKANGAVSTTFGGGDGKVFRDYGGDENPGTMLRQDDGKLVFIGFRPAPQAMRAFRLEADGSKDTGFGTAGLAEVEFTGTAGAFGGALDNSGRIVAVGRVGIGNAADFALTRLEG